LETIPIAFFGNGHDNMKIHRWGVAGHVTIRSVSLQIGTRFSAMFPNLNIDNVNALRLTGYRIAKRIAFIIYQWPNIDANIIPLGIIQMPSVVAISSGLTSAGVR
jgi:hypothetical protein